MLNKLVVNRIVDNFAASVRNAALPQELSNFRVNPVFYCRGVASVWTRPWSVSISGFVCRPSHG